MTLPIASTKNPSPIPPSSQGPFVSMDAFIMESPVIDSFFDDAPLHHPPPPSRAKKTIAVAISRAHIMAGIRRIRQGSLASNRLRGSSIRNGDDPCGSHDCYIWHDASIKRRSYRQAGKNPARPSQRPMASDGTPQGCDARYRPRWPSGTSMQYCVGRAYSEYQCGARKGHGPNTQPV
jgi:hypothetical protein